MATLTRRELLLAAPAAALVAGCRGRDGGSSAIYLRGNGPDPDSLDPHKARTTESMVVLR